MYTLRQRIRADKINCMPWKIYRYNIQRLPVSSQCLFARGGVNYDVLEMELREEGWLFPTEKIFEVLEDVRNLKRGNMAVFEIQEDCPFDDTWTEEDYINYYENEGEVK